MKRNQNHLLVTGGAGFIGANFVHFWHKRHPQDKIIILDALTYAGHLANLKGALEQSNILFIKGRIEDLALVSNLLEQEQVNIIVNFAAESHVDRSIHDPDQFIRTNILGTYTLLKAAKAIWLDKKILGKTSIRFHHVSTDEVYGSLGPEDPAFNEQTPYRPNSPYAASKASSDHLVRAFYKTYGLPVTISNCSNNYGPFQHPEKLIPLMIFNMLQGSPLPIYGSGQNIRDWLHVHDHCQALELILNTGQAGETYNIGGHCERTNLEVVEELTTIMDELKPHSPHYPHKQLISFVPDRPGHDLRYAIDSHKISQKLGFRAKTDFAQGLRQTVCWYLEHLDWIEEVSQDLGMWLKTNYEQR